MDVDWGRATSAEVRDFVLWLAQANKPRRAARTASAATAGTLNPVTRKQHLDDRYLRFPRFSGDFVICGVRWVLVE